MADRISVGEVVVRSVRLRGRTWHVDRKAEIDRVFGVLRQFVYGKCGNRSVSWYRGTSLSHLEFDYSESVLLRRMGVRPVRNWVYVGVCLDGILIVDMMVECEDGMSYSRGECRAVDLGTIPSEEEIESRKMAIRSGVGLRRYSEGSAGISGAGIREIGIREIMDAST